MSESAKLEIEELYKQAMFLMNRGDATSTDVGQAIEILEKAAAINPGNIKVEWALAKGFQFLTNRTYDKAFFYKMANKAYVKFKMIQQEYKEEPTDIYSEILRELAWSCIATDRFDEAIYYTDVARKFNPKDYTLDANHALAHLMKKNVDHALKLAESALMKDPSDEITQSVVNIIKKVKDGTRPWFNSYYEMINFLGQLKQ